MITAQQLATALNIPLVRATNWLDPLNLAIDRWHITTPQRICMFIAQIALESNYLTAVSENLNYSEEQLLKMFPSHFAPDQARAYAHQPMRIANLAYANRHGNGDEVSGDGWKYRGHGLTQLTFKDNYTAYASDSGTDVMSNPSLLADMVISADCAGWFWHKGACRSKELLSDQALHALAQIGMHEGASLNEVADHGLFEVTTLCINGSLNGESSRLSLWANCKQVWHVQ